MEVSATLCFFGNKIVALTKELPMMHAMVMGTANRIGISSKNISMGRSRAPPPIPAMEDTHPITHKQVYAIK